MAAVWDSCASLADHRNFKRNMRFGRILGLMKQSSNFYGCFFLLGFCLWGRMRMSANFVRGVSSFKFQPMERLQGGAAGDD